MHLSFLTLRCFRVVFVAALLLYPYSFCCLLALSTEPQLESESFTWSGQRQEHSSMTLRWPQVPCTVGAKRGFPGKPWGARKHIVQTCADWFLGVSWVAVQLLLEDPAASIRGRTSKGYGDIVTYCSSQVYSTQMPICKKPHSEWTKMRRTCCFQQDSPLDEAEAEDSPLQAAELEFSFLPSRYAALRPEEGETGKKQKLKAGCCGCVAQKGFQFLNLAQRCSFSFSCCGSVSIQEIADYVSGQVLPLLLPCEKKLRGMLDGTVFKQQACAAFVPLKVTNLDKFMIRVWTYL